MRTWEQDGWLAAVEATSASLRSFAQRGRVARLRLLHVTAPDLRGLEGWEQLVELDVQMGRLRSLDGIAALPRLRSLWVWLGPGRRMPLEVGALAELRQLRSLHLKGAEPVVDLEPVGELTGLEELYVQHFTGDGTDRFAQLPLEQLDSLRSLTWSSAGRYGVADDHDKLAGLRRLEVCELDLVVSAPLEPLYGLPELREVRLRHVDGEVAARRFRSARPDVELLVDAPPLPVEPAIRVGELAIHRFVDDDGAVWWSIFQDIAGLLGVETNDEAEARVIAALYAEAPEVAERAEFDTEADAFGVRCDEEADIRLIAALITDLQSSGYGPS